MKFAFQCQLSVNSIFQDCKLPIWMLFLADLKQVREVIKDSKVHLYKASVQQGKGGSKNEIPFYGYGRCNGTEYNRHQGQTRLITGTGVRKA